MSRTPLLITLRKAAIIAQLCEEQRISTAKGEAVGGLHFAGEHTSLAFQGFMNGAVESGERVAREILALGARPSWSLGS